jgi:hypothetical protein
VGTGALPKIRYNQEKRLKLFYSEDYKMPAGQMPMMLFKLANL